MSTIATEMESAASELEAEFFSFAEREDGPGQRAAKEQLLLLLAAAGRGRALTREETLRIVADAGKLQNARGKELTSRADGRGNGRKVRPEPDLAYNANVNGVKRRVNVEVDSDPNAAAKHIRELKYADPKGLHVAVVVHPVTGATVDGMVWDPKLKQARRMTRAEVTALQQGKLPKALIPAPLRKQTNQAVPPRKPRSAKSVGNALNTAVAGLNKPRPKPKAAPPKRGGRKGSRESELEFAASELESELGFGAEQMDVDVPGIPGVNQWFVSSGEARRAALRAATSAGSGFTIAHDPRPSRGQPHYHVQGPDGTRVSGHFFYGSRPPRRVLRGRPNRESELEVAAARFEFEVL